MSPEDEPTYCLTVFTGSLNICVYGTRSGLLPAYEDWRDLTIDTTGRKFTVEGHDGSAGRSPILLALDFNIIQGMQLTRE